VRHLQWFRLWISLGGSDLQSQQGPFTAPIGLNDDEAVDLSHHSDVEPEEALEDDVVLSRALDEDATYSGDEDLIDDALEDENDLNHTNEPLFIHKDTANRVDLELQLNRVIWKVRLSPFFSIKIQSGADSGWLFLFRLPDTLTGFATMCAPDTCSWKPVLLSPSTDHTLYRVMSAPDGTALLRCSRQHCACSKHCKCSSSFFSLRCV
jgi:hypothetical protein